MKVAPDAVTGEDWRALQEGTVLVVRTAEARFAVSGKGALACLQGVVTNDLNAVPDGARSFGALLTQKGMIVTPLWIERESAAAFVIEAPLAAAATLRDTFAKLLPPRLCSWQDVTDATVGIGLYGPGAETLAPGAPAPLRPAVVRGAAGFDGRLPAQAVPEFAARMARAGAAGGTQALMDSCRILAGIPSLGAEIDDRTLPQEVRLEELGAISYTKGCYLGQETVARLHFRGHANRRLVLLVLDDEPAATPLELAHEGKVVGRLTSACWSQELDAWIAQALLRREVEDGADLELPSGSGAVVRTDRWLRDP